MAKHKKLKAIILANLISFIGYQFFVPFYALFAKDLGADIRAIGFIWSFYSILTAITMLVFGKLENAYSKEKIVVYGFFMYSVGAFAFLLVSNIATLMLVLAFNALLGGITIPAYKTLFTHLQDKDRESEEWSWLEASNMIAISVGSAIGGIVLATLGFNGLFIIMGTIQLVAGIIIYKSLKRKISIEGDLLKATSVAKSYLSK